MKKATLVIMAAGIGSRFGTGIKQLEPVGPNDELIIDYSIYDAIRAGFDKIVFVIRKDLEKDFKERIGNRVEKVVEVAYAYQELWDIPKEYENLLEIRKKPWGTGQAILACKNIVQEPFLIINSDDYYGKEAYEKAYKYLASGMCQDVKMNMCMVGFILNNTLSDNGTVTRGVCKVDENCMLTDIEETYGIRKEDDNIIERNGKRLDGNASVSMNMWGAPVEFIDVLESGFKEFLEHIDESNITKEYLLPQIIGTLIRKGEAQVKVLESHDKWFGVTYKEDKECVVEELQRLIEAGVYPEKLY